jgi:hypothetical protein
MTALIDLIPAPRTHELTTVHLRIHVHRRPQGGWCADIDDELDRQPDDPYWFIGNCGSVAEAVTAACDQLAAMAADPDSIRAGGRLSGWTDPSLTASCPQPTPKAAPAGATR